MHLFNCFFVTDFVRKTMTTRTVGHQQTEHHKKHSSTNESYRMSKCFSESWPFCWQSWKPRVPESPTSILSETMEKSELCTEFEQNPLKMKKAIAYQRISLTSCHFVSQSLDQALDVC